MIVDDEFMSEIPLKQPRFNYVNHLHIFLQEN